MNRVDLFKELALFGLGTFILLMALLIFFRLYRRSQARSSDLPAGMTVQDLKKLEGKHLLSPEEMKRVREAMARQYLDVEREKEKKSVPPDVSGLEALRLEAERLQAQGIAKGTKGAEGKVQVAKQGADVAEQEIAGPTIPPLPPEAIESPGAAVPQTAPAQLPEHLQSMVGRSRTDLEDLLNAGFLTREEVDLVLVARGEAP